MSSYLNVEGRFIKEGHLRQFLEAKQEFAKQKCQGRAFTENVSTENGKEKDVKAG